MKINNLKSELNYYHDDLNIEPNANKLPLAVHQDCFPDDYFFLNCPY